MTKPIKIVQRNTGNSAMSELENRIIRLEGNVQQIQVEIAKINTRLDTELPHLATKAELREVEGKLSTEIVKSRNTIILWIIGVAMATGLVNWLGSSSSHAHNNPAITMEQTKPG